MRKDRLNLFPMALSPIWKGGCMVILGGCICITTLVLYRRFLVRITFITLVIYKSFVYSYSINSSISISHLSIFNLSSSSLVFINMGRSFLKRLEDNKIRVRFVIRSSGALIDRSYNR